MFCEETLNLELSRNVSVHEFYRFKALISLEQVNTSKWAKKKKTVLINKTAMVGRYKLSLDANGCCYAMIEMTCHVNHSLY